MPDAQGAPHCAQKAARGVGSVFRSTRGAARRELAAIQHYTDLENIENSDEVCLGVCVTVWIASFIWLGAVLLARLDKAPSLSQWSRWPPWGHRAPFSPAIADLELGVGDRRPEDVFAVCQEDGRLLANLSCFLDCSQAFMDGATARHAFMELDCNRDFKVDEEELLHAFAMEGFECVATTMPMLTTAPAIVIPPTTKTSTTVRPSTSSATFLPQSSRSTTQRPVVPLEPPTCRNDFGSAVGSTFFVDNSQFRAYSPGLGYRASEHLTDLAGASKYAAWGADIVGIESAAGWLKVGDSYLPLALEGIPVLVPKVEMVAVVGHLAYARLKADGPLFMEASRAIQSEVASAAGTGNDADRVVVEFADCKASGSAEARRLSEAAGSSLVVRATVAPPAGVSAETLRSKWRSGDSPCEAVLAGLAGVPGIDWVADGGIALVECKVDGAVVGPGEDRDHPTRSPQVETSTSPTSSTSSTSTIRPQTTTQPPPNPWPTPGPSALVLDEYRSHLGNQGENAAVQMVVKQVMFDRLSDSQLLALKGVLVEQFASAAGVNPSAVKDLGGSAAGVSITGESAAFGRKSLIVNCRLELPVGETVSTAGGSLRAEIMKARVGQLISRIPGIQEAIDGGIIDPSKIGIGVAESSQDKFFQADDNFNNMLDLAEFQSAARKYLDPPLTNEQAKSLFPLLDSNHDKQLSDAEFFASGPRW